MDISCYAYAVATQLHVPFDHLPLALTIICVGSNDNAVYGKTRFVFDSTFLMPPVAWFPVGSRRGGRYVFELSGTIWFVYFRFHLVIQWSWTVTEVVKTLDVGLKPRQIEVSRKDFNTYLPARRSPHGNRKSVKLEGRFKYKSSLSIYCIIPAPLTYDFQRWHEMTTRGVSLCNCSAVR